MLFKLDYKKQDDPYNMPIAHYHEYHELYYLLSGERYYLLEDRIYHINEGDLILIPPNLLHQTADVGNGSHERMIVYFSERFIQKPAFSSSDQDLLSCFTQKNKAIRLSISEQAFVQNIFNKMDKEQNENSLYSTLYKRILLTELLIFVNRRQAGQQEVYFRAASPMHTKVHEVMRYIREHYSESLSLYSIAQEFYVSPYYLSRIFKKSSGLTLIEYLNNIRIREAQRLLRESSLSVTEIAQKVGYENSTHFGRTFKKISGVSALKYRKSLTAQN